MNKRFFERLIGFNVKSPAVVLPGFRFISPSTIFEKLKSVYHHPLRANRRFQQINTGLPVAYVKF